MFWSFFDSGMEIFFDMALEALINNVYIMVEEVEKLEEE
jgi:hypothetical protein